MPGLPGAKIRKVMGEIWLRLLAAFWGRVNEPQISQPTANSSCSKTPRSSYGRQTGAAGGYQDLVGRCSASSPADDTSRFGAATSRSLSTTGSAGGALMPALQSRRSSGMSTHGGGSPPGASRYRPINSISYLGTQTLLSHF